MNSYLEDDEELQPLDEEAPAPRPKPRWWEVAGVGSPPNVDADAPVPRNITEMDAAPEAMPEGPSIRNVRNPVSVKRETAENALATKKNEQPGENHPKWWQRVAAGAVGFGAGYVNADGKNHPHVDASGAVDTIMGGPQQREKVAAWQRGVAGAQANVDAAKSNEQAWFKNESLQNDEQYKAAQEGRLNAQAKREAGRNDLDAAKAKQSDAEKQDALALKAREDAYLLKQGEQPPEGWDVIQSAANPGRAYAAPPRFAKLPKELVDYTPGRKAGEVVPISELKAARAAAQKDTLAQNKPLADNVERILLNPKGYTPDQVKKAQEMFDKAHRPPINNEGRKDKTAGLKAYTPALESGERFNVMAKNYEDAVQHHDQQAMLSLLANHLGMTMGLQKGSRLTKDIIREAENSRPWLQGMAAKFDSNGYLTGVNLTPEQMRQMVNLGRERFSEDISKGRSEAKYMGIEDDGPTRIPNKSTINHYTALANGDAVKARALAKADGWTVE